MKRARFAVIMVFLVALHTIIPTLTAAQTYEDCILENMKGVQDKTAAIAIMRACREKTTPQKCRHFLPFNLNPPPNNPFADLVPDGLETCLEECAKAGMWNRTFGDCRF